MVTIPGRAFTLVALALAAAAELPAQQIRGRVLDDSTHDPLAGVLVTVPNSTTAASTDLTGTFLLTLPRPGLVTLQLTLTGYATLETDTIRVTEATTETIVLSLRRTAIPIDTIVVAAEARDPGGFYERARNPGGFGQFLTRQDINTRPAAGRTTELLRGLRGVEILPVRRPRSSATSNMIVMSGTMGRCQPAIFIDGSHVRQFPESGIDDFLKPDMLEGVEIYGRSASAPAWLGAPPNCGVVAFWTRTGRGEQAEKWTLKRVLTAAGIATAMLTLLVFAR